MMLSSIRAVYRKNKKSFMYYHPLLLIFNRILSNILLILGVYFINLMFVEVGYYSMNVAMSIHEYLDFAFIGIVFYGYTISIILNVSRYLITELYQGTITSLFISPYNLLGVFLGSYFEQFIRSTIEFTVLLVFIYLLSPTIQSFGLKYLFIGMILINIASLVIGFLLSGIMLILRETFVLQNTLIMILGILSGVVFPVQSFPAKLQLITEMLPITIALNIVRNGKVDGLEFQQIGIFLLSICLIAGVGYIIFKFVESKYIELLVE